MHFRCDRSAIWVVLHIGGLVFGLMVFAFSIYDWSQYHFSLGPNVRIYPGAPDSSSGARWLFISGLILSGYFGSALYASTLSPESSDAQKHDEPKNGA